ncbi:MAG: hypothetical protein JW704_06875 [Anaerolineaceae bacterium]|nr:hypothetical protein [Anaerolineaceae bacterium]MBN2676557.1 hypothetical protein [Anaerolineaceae bacterium]
MPEDHPASRLIILSGLRGSGKSTLLQSAIGRVRNSGQDVAGILSLPVEKNGLKVAIDGLDLRKGEKQRLAVRNSGSQGALDTDRWQFNPHRMRWANDLLEAVSACDLLVVDELGVLEFERGQGWLAGLKALDKGRYKAAIVVIRPELLAKARARWPGAQVITLTVDERNAILEELVCRVMKLLEKA